MEGKQQKGSLVVEDHLPSSTFLIDLLIVSKIWHGNLGSNFIHSPAPQTQNKIDLKQTSDWAKGCKSKLILSLLFRPKHISQAIEILVYSKLIQSIRTFSPLLFFNDRYFSYGLLFVMTCMRSNFLQLMFLNYPHLKENPYHFHYEFVMFFLQVI